MYLKNKAFYSLLTVFVLLSIVLLLIFEPYTTAAVLSTLSFAVKKLIPALFPFMALSSFASHLELFSPIDKLLPLSRMLKLPQACASVIFPSYFSSAPIGAANAASLSESGKISKEDAAYLTAMCSNPSPAFLISAVGGMWHNKSFGVFLYLTASLSSLAIAFFLSRKREHLVAHVSKKSMQSSLSLPAVLCRSISDAAYSCLVLVAFMSFFSVITAIAECIFPILTSSVTLFAEFSRAAVFGAELGGALGAAYTGFAIGFSGLSVMLQVYSFSSRAGISMKPYIFSKLAEGIICSVCSLLFYLTSPSFKGSAAPTVSGEIIIQPQKTALLILILCAVYFIFSYGYGKMKSRTSK